VMVQDVREAGLPNLKAELSTKCCLMPQVRPGGGTKRGKRSHLRYKGGKGAPEPFVKNSHGVAGGGRVHREKKKEKKRQKIGIPNLRNGSRFR